MGADETKAHLDKLTTSYKVLLEEIKKTTK